MTAYDAMKPITDLYLPDPTALRVQHVVNVGHDDSLRQIFVRHEDGVVYSHHEWALHRTRESAEAWLRKFVQHELPLLRERLERFEAFDVTSWDAGSFPTPVMSV